MDSLLTDRTMGHRTLFLVFNPLAGPEVFPAGWAKKVF